MADQFLDNSRQTNTIASNSPLLSVIVPFFNEEESVGGMYDAIVQSLSRLDTSFEMVFVDDGSVDGTLRVATEIARGDPRLRVIKFRKNYGQTPAMAAGIEYARGSILVTMDGDLQNDPADIGNFLAKLEEGFDIVVGWRFNRQDKLISRKIPSRVANWLIGKVTGVPIKDNGCSLKAYRASLIKSIPLYSEMHRFIPAMASIAGPRIAEIKVRHHARKFGESKYGLSRVQKVLLDLLVIKTIAAFTSRPLRWFCLLATPVTLIGLYALGYSLWMWSGIDGQLSLPLAGTGVMFLVSALILVSAGLLGELIYNLGDMREYEFSSLTQEVRRASPNGSQRLQ